MYRFTKENNTLEIRVSKLVVPTRSVALVDSSVLIYNNYAFHFKKIFGKKILPDTAILLVDCITRLYSISFALHQ